MTSKILAAFLLASITSAGVAHAQGGGVVSPTITIPGATVSNVRISTSTAPSPAAAEPAPEAAPEDAATTTEKNAPKNATFSVGHGDVPDDYRLKGMPSIYDVTSNGSLRLYALQLMAMNDGLEHVSLKKDQTIEARYKTHATLFNLIPVPMPTYVRIATDGTISVHYPWYSFLMKPGYPRADVETALKAEAARTISRGDDKSGRRALVTDDSIENVDPVTRIVGAATGTPAPGSTLSLRLRASILERMASYLRAQEQGTLEVAG